MKTSFVVLLAAAAATVLAAPNPAADGYTAEDAIEARQDNCFYPSGCARNWRGNCQDYCGTRKFSHMSSDGCPWLAKKCCCIRR